MIKSLPNAITIGRIIAVPCVVWLLLEEDFSLAFWVFVAAGISDGIDGFLAKILNAQSKLGGFLDPLADKALLISVFVTLAYLGRVEIWFVGLLLLRDLVILTGAYFYHVKTRALEMTPLLIGKINTGFLVVFAGALLAIPGFGLAAEMTLSIMLWLTTLTLALSGIIYVVKWGKMAAQFKATGGTEEGL